jgi:hypothetical protein
MLFLFKKNLWIKGLPFMSQLKDLLLSHREWIAPRSDQHTVIGVPDSRDHRKTFVEPGGSFSPGVGSFGVSVWVYDQVENRLFAPEEMASGELHWEWEQGYLPVLNSRWQTPFFEINLQLFAASLFNLENVVNSLKVTITNRVNQYRRFSVYLVIRPYGPAGGKVNNLSIAEQNMARAIKVNGKIALLAGQTWDEFGAVSYGESGEEISTYLKKGQLPENQVVADKLGLCTGALAYNLNLLPQTRAELVFDFFVHPLEQDYLRSFQDYHNQTYTHKLGKILQYWEQQLKVVQLDLPDKRFSNAFYSILAQHLMATVNKEVRISTITYPLFWLRDGVYIINALDKAGFHQEVRAQLSQVQSRIFAGGFGAEPDAFGEAIWTFHTHFKLTNDREWLETVYPSLKERADWIIKARHTREHLYADTQTRVPDRRYSADSDLICEPARDGLIQGRMDWHRPLIWINAFAWLGLSVMTEMAGLLEYEDEAELYRQEASELKEALHKYAFTQAHFGENERDLVCAMWPSNAFTPEEVRNHYDIWWTKARFKENGEYNPEALWKYFELGQAHNYLFLGERDKTLQTVNYYLEHHDVQNLYGWLEDSYDIAEHWSQIEGWYKLPSRQPHGWVSSEFFLLLRDLWLYEDQDQETLVLGAGVPAEWLQQPNTWQIVNMPSSFGPVDFRVLVPDAGARQIQIEVTFHSSERLPQQIAIGLPWPWSGAGAELQTNKGFVDKDKNRVIVPISEYKAHGKVNLLIT